MSACFTFAQKIAKGVHFSFSGFGLVIYGVEKRGLNGFLRLFMVDSSVKLILDYNYTCNMPPGQYTAKFLVSRIISRDISMFEILHPNPSDNNPQPRHDSRQRNQRGIVPHNGQGRIILQLRRRVRRLSHIPCPAPDTETAAHTDHESQPGNNEYDPPPPLCFGVVPCFHHVGGRPGAGGKVMVGARHGSKGGFRCSTRVCMCMCMGVRMRVHVRVDMSRLRSVLVLKLELS